MPAELLAVRHQTHGGVLEQFTLAQELKNLFRAQPTWANLHPVQQEGLDMLAVKLSRIFTGNANEPDHWLDSSGYMDCVHEWLTDKAKLVSVSAGLSPIEDTDLPAKLRELLRDAKFDIRRFAASTEVVISFVDGEQWKTMLALLTSLKG